MSIFKNKFFLWLISIMVLILIIFSYFKIREYNILKDAFAFKYEDVDSTWRIKKGENIHDYKYNMESEEIDELSKILTSSKLKKATINDSPQNNLGSLSIQVSEKLRKPSDSISVKYQRNITLVPIDKSRVYIFLEINKPRNDNSFNLDTILQKFYIIDSKRLVELINRNA